VQAAEALEAVLPSDPMTSRSSSSGGILAVERGKGFNMAAKVSLDLQAALDRDAAR
jgi:hypothetical protein